VLPLIWSVLYSLWIAKTNNIPIVLKFKENFGKPRIYKMGKFEYRQITYNEIADSLDNLFGKEVVIDINKEDYDSFLKLTST
jgi:hypothetical protein